MKKKGLYAIFGFFLVVLFIILFAFVFGFIGKKVEEKQAHCEDQFIEIQQLQTKLTEQTENEKNFRDETIRKIGLLKKSLETSLLKEGEKQNEIIKKFELEKKKLKEENSNLLSQIERIEKDKKTLEKKKCEILDLYKNTEDKYFTTSNSAITYSQFEKEMGDLNKSVFDLSDNEIEEAHKKLKLLSKKYNWNDLSLHVFEMFSQTGLVNLFQKQNVDGFLYTKEDGKVFNLDGKHYIQNYRGYEKKIFFPKVLRWMFEESIVKENYPESILDVGVGYGTLLLYGYFLGKRKIKAVGLDVISLNQLFSKEILERFENVKFYGNYSIVFGEKWGNQEFVLNESYDWIFFTEVLEHIAYYPVGVMIKMRNLLTDNGYLFMGTPEPKKKRILYG